MLIASEFGNHPKPKPNPHEPNRKPTQNPGGYEAALDPWLQQLWPALRQAFPLPAGVQPPVLNAAAKLQLGPPKYKVTLLPSAAAAAMANGAAANGTGGEHEAQEECWQREAVAAAAAFRAVSMEASGLPPGTSNGSAPPPSASAAAAQPPHYGPWRPFMAPLLVNRRLTSQDHFQDTRHLEFDLEGSGMAYEPGDLLAIFPRTPEEDFQVRDVVHSPRIMKRAGDL